MCCTSTKPGTNAISGTGTKSSTKPSTNAISGTGTNSSTGASAETSRRNSFKSG